MTYQACRLLQKAGSYGTPVSMQLMQKCYDIFIPLSMDAGPLLTQWKQSRRGNCFKQLKQVKPWTKVPNMENQ